MKTKRRIAILGGGPSALFVYKRFVDAQATEFRIDIFEKKNRLGSGMPYSAEGANDEHITNVSGNEIPEIVSSVEDWILAVSPDKLKHFHIDKERFNDYKVLPRLLFGEYLSAQFDLLLKKAKEAGVETHVHLNSQVTDVIDDPKQALVTIEVSEKEYLDYDHVILCTGHTWPKKNEGNVPGYFDSPYPPGKLPKNINHPVAIKGSSLTAIDAIRTLARDNGQFSKDADGILSYQLSADSKNFKLIMHSRSGMLPALRFHLEDPHLSKETILSAEEVKLNRAANDGFLSLDYVFEKNFKLMFREKDPAFYSRIEKMDLETFVTSMMDLRERLPAFQLFKAEYAEAEKSIKRRESVYWKEMLGTLSFAMNYPAKYLSAEDMLRLQQVLMPLISIVIAFVPQSSAEELLALHEAGILDIVSVGDDSVVEVDANNNIIYQYTDEDNKKQSVLFKTFIDCVGQRHLNLDDLPFESLRSRKTLSPARLLFRDSKCAKEEISNGNENVIQDNTGRYYLNVPGVTINDRFQAVDEYEALNERIYIMAVPFIGGYNPDYSGLDFCEAASSLVFESLI